MRTKLSYEQQREPEALPKRIEALEAQQKALAERLAGSELCANEPQRVAELHARHAAIDDEMLIAMERWEALGSR